MRMLTQLLLVVTLCPVIACCLSANEPSIIAKGEGSDAPKQPQAAIGVDGSAHLVYGVAQNVYYCYADKVGAALSEPRLAFRVPNLALGKRRGPRVVVAENIAIVTAIGGEVGQGRDGNLLAWHSSDHGTTWTGPVRVNDALDSAREGLHCMAASSDGIVYCGWLDLRNNRTEVFISQSADGGKSWSRNQNVYISPEKGVCECCHPSIAIGPDKSVHVMFRNNLAGNRDMYVTTSVDGGKSFLGAKKLGLDSWKLDACPMDGGMISVAQGGATISVWRRDNHIYMSNGKKLDELPIARGQQPWIATSENESLMVWTGNREGELYLKNAVKDVPISIDIAARDPMIVASPTGQGPMLVCWESTDGGRAVVKACAVDPHNIKTIRSSAATR